MPSELDNRLKVQILFESGISDIKIIQNATKLHVKTIQRIIKRIKSGEGIQRRRQSGRPRKYTSNDRNRLSNLANSHPKYSSARLGEMAKSRGSPPVSARTVRRYLKESGYLKLLPEPIPMLTRSHMQKRLNWCYKYRNFDWNKVVLTDESYFQMFRSKVKQWGKKRRTYKTSQSSPSVMVWGY